MAGMTDIRDFLGALPRPDLSPSMLTSFLTEILKGAAVMEEGQRPIYLDMQATTPVDPRVLDAMLPLYVGVYGFGLLILVISVEFAGQSSAIGGSIGVARQVEEG